MFSVVLAGGGGCGAPESRAPEAVAADVRDGLVSVAAAREVYEVVLTPALDVDVQATKDSRADIRRRST